MSLQTLKNNYYVILVIPLNHLSSNTWSLTFFVIKLKITRVIKKYFYFGHDAVLAVTGRPPEAAGDQVGGDLLLLRLHEQHLGLHRGVVVQEAVEGAVHAVIEEEHRVIFFAWVQQFTGLRIYLQIWCWKSHRWCWRRECRRRLRSISLDFLISDLMTRLVSCVDVVISWSLMARLHWVSLQKIRMYILGNNSQNLFDEMTRNITLWIDMDCRYMSQLLYACQSARPSVTFLSDF